MISIIKINKTDQLSFLTIDENSKDVPSKVSIPNLKLNANLNDIATVVNSYAQLKKGSLFKTAIVDESLLIK